MVFIFTGRKPKRHKMRFFFSFLDEDQKLPMIWLSCQLYPIFYLYWWAFRKATFSPSRSLLNINVTKTNPDNL